MRQMDQTCSIRPDSAYDVFRLDQAAPNDVVKLNVGPIVLNVPERANRGRSDLYVVVEGWLVFEGDFAAAAPLKTKTYGTNVAYFKRKGDDLEQVYGAHYDMDEVRFGHPVFHAQIGTNLGLAQAVKEHFRLDLNVVSQMGAILGNVRLPCAQMDVFAAVTQICADHLVGQNVAVEVRRAFEDLREASDFLVGAAHRLGYLNGAEPANCYQSRHWYASPIAV
ncbi:hypothetical protein [Brevundimonas sp. P7753]|uniref:hypothetical protein n=1 Tax=Brevundimonas sp. P7753 TaxID=2726982 RepID=UPI0015BD1AA4|nr:hypothetical protein [Brevundimonas sp. P7753]NWE53815.1 hypothetical protein [Brevundimonas sp. P7753]